MAKRRKPMTSQAKCRLMVLGPICLVLILSFLFTMFSYTATLYQLRKEKEFLDNHLKQLQENAENLKIEISKLQTPEELAKFARENYLYSKDGEIIVKIKEQQEEITAQEEKLQVSKKTIFISFAIIIVVFGYIFWKGLFHKKSA